MANNTRRRGMSPVLAFFLGFLIGIIVLIGAVAGAIYFALSYKLDKIEANKDEEGNYIYINADPDNGGVENVLALVKKVTELSKNPSSLTIGQVEDLLPVANKLTDGIQSALDKYISIDMDELKRTPFSELGNYLQDIVMDLQPAALIEQFVGGDITENFIVQTILYDEQGKALTLREFSEGNALDALYEKQLVEFLNESDEITGRLLGEITIGDLVNGNVNFADIINTIHVTDFVDIDPENNILVYFGYGITGVTNNNGVYTGKYKLENGDVVDCYIETEANGSSVKITQAYYFDQSGEKVVIEGTSVNEINSRMDNLMDELTLPDLIVVNAPTGSDKNAIMIFLAYSTADITAEIGYGYNYTGIYYPENGEPEKSYIFAENGKITDICVIRDGKFVSVERTTVNGVSAQINRLTAVLKLKDVIDVENSDSKLLKKLGDYTINSVGSAINDLTLSDVVDVTISGETLDTSEVVLAYMVYGLGDVIAENGSVAGKDYTHKGTYYPLDGEPEQCYVLCEGTTVKEVFTVKDGNVQINEGTKINAVSARVGGITNDLTIGQLMTIDDSNTIMKAISDSTISSLPEDINKISINELYADNIYSPSTSQSENVVRYLAVSESALHRAVSYTEGYVYYVLQDGNYVLASTTGKLSGFESETEYYTAGEGKILFDTAYLYYVENENGKFELAGEKGKVVQFTENLYTYGAANAMWKLLIYSEGEESAFSVNELTNLITNVSANIQHSTMRELDEAGVINMGANLEKELSWNDGGKYYESKIGDLTLKELLDAIVIISDTLPSQS